MLSGETRIRWLIDGTLPQVEGQQPDTLPHRNGDVFKEAAHEGRWLVSKDQHLLEPGNMPTDCPPVVVLRGSEYTGEGLTRNLLHFEFCLSRSNIPQPVEGERFLIEMDRAIYRLLPGGGVEELETWKIPSVKPVLTMGASA